MPYRLKNGKKFAVHKGNFLSELIYINGSYEPLETELVASVLRHGDIFIDIGANTGYFTAMASASVGESGELHSFEPGAATYQALLETIKTLKINNAITHNAAVADKSGNVEFWVSNIGKDAQQSILPVSGLTGNSRCVSVKSVSLDDYLKNWTSECRKRLRIVKCDVEGAEVRVLRGALSLFDGEDAPIWLVEHNRPALKEHGFDSTDLCSFFINYFLFFIPLAWPPSVRLFDKAKAVLAPAELPDECNIVAVPKFGFHRGTLSELRSAGLLE